MIIVIVDYNCIIYFRTKTITFKSWKCFFLAADRIDSGRCSGRHRVGVARADVYVGNFSGLRSMVWANFCAVAGFANKKPCTRSKSIARTVKKSGRVSTP